MAVRARWRANGRWKPRAGENARDATKQQHPGVAEEEEEEEEEEERGREQMRDREKMEIIPNSSAGWLAG